MPNIRPLPPHLQDVARKQLNEDPKRIDSDLAHIKDWLSKQPHLKARTDDQFLIAFLRGCKYSLERTKEKLDFYYTSRTALKEFFNDRDPLTPKIQKILNLGVMLPLPEADELGRRIFIFRSGKYDPNEISIADICKVNFMLMDYMIMNDDSFTTAGIISILDMSDATLAHATQMSPTLMKQTMRCSQDGYPFRPKKLLYIHVPHFFETIFNLFKTFAKEKLQKRMHVHGDDLNSLYQDVPQKLLPKEYGGEAGSIEEISSKFKKDLESYRDWFVEDAKYGADESKRPGKPKTYEDLFGIEGSFRQLTVD